MGGRLFVDIGSNNSAMKVPELVKLITPEN
jgi:hypothetical protein